MADSIRLYLDAHGHYDNAARQASDLIGIVQEVAKRLSNDPMTFMFSNTEPGMPPGVAISRNPNSVDGKPWPTAGELQTALASLHQAKQSLSGAWTALAHDDRKGLVPPPAGFVPTRRIESI